MLKLSKFTTLAAAALSMIDARKASDFF